MTGLFIMPQDVDLDSALGKEEFMAMAPREEKVGNFNHLQRAFVNVVRAQQGWILTCH
jgi:hypothetical protein